MKVGGSGIGPGTHTACVRVDNLGDGANITVGCRSVTMPTGSPFGSLDVATGGAEQLTVAGWSVDPDTTAPIATHIYVDGSGVALLVADQPRADVAGVFPAYGPNHGYGVTVAATPGTHQVCAWAIDVGAGDNTANCRTVTVTSRPPFGSLDVATAGTGNVRVEGWAIDPSVPTTPVSIHVYVDGRFWTGATASVTRNDVGTAYPGTGTSHGYSIVLAPLTGGTHQVCTYAINDGPGDNTTLGCRTVALSMPGTFGAISPAFANGSPGSAPSRFFSTHVPRFTGEVRVPFEVIDSTDAWVTTPPR